MGWKIEYRDLHRDDLSQEFDSREGAIRQRVATGSRIPRFGLSVPTVRLCRGPRSNGTIKPRSTRESCDGGALSMAA